MVKEINSLQYGVVKLLMEMKLRPLWCRSTWMCGTQQKHSVNSKFNVPSQEALIPLDNFSYIPSVLPGKFRNHHHPSRVRL
jgi:hypothetical protein